MKMYRVLSWGTRIEELEVDKTTDSFVFRTSGTRKSREARSSCYASWFDTHEGAVEHIRKRFQGEIDSAERRANHAREQLAAFELTVTK